MSTTAATIRKGTTVEPVWRGTFISDARPTEAGDPATYFRREFEVGRSLQRATLRVTALGIVVAHINGHRVGDDVLSPGWTSYRHHLDVRSYDITELLAEGSNAVGAVVGEGWASGALTWNNTRHIYADRPALFAEITLEYAGRTEVVATDDSFRVGTGGVRGNGIYAGETFDARLEPDGWTRADFDDEDWVPASTVDWSTETLRAPPGPPIRRQEAVPPVDVRRTDVGRYIVDFGQVLTGWVRLRATGPAGTTITMRHAEILTPGGELERETNRSAEATDRYVLAGTGVETYEPQFTFHGFRYVEFEGWPGELAADDLSAVVVHSEMARTGWFETSSALVTRLHNNIVWSMRGNFVGIPTDCPQRDERLGWTGDINAFASTATFLYDVRGVLDSWLRDLAAEQADIGTVPWVVPDVLPHASSATALWSDVAVNLPWQLYQEYGDLDLLRSAYASMTSFVREVEGQLSDEYLWNKGFQFGDWLDPDAPANDPGGSRTDRYLVAQAYLCRTTAQMAATADLLGETADAEDFRALNVRIRDAFVHEYLTPAGRLASETATAYALAIVFGLLDDGQRERAGNLLARLVERDGYTIRTGFAGTPLLTEALSSTGHTAEAYRLLMQEECPSFLYPVTRGATTIWERWDAVRPDGTVNSTGMTSLNHYALGAVADWMHRVVGGLQSLEPGWSRIRIAPEPGGGLTSAKVGHTTVHGHVACEWRIADGRMTLAVDIPDGTSATVVLPGAPDGRVDEVGPGEHSWEYELPADYVTGTTLTLASTLRDLMNDARVWPAVSAMLAGHLPDVSMDAIGSLFGDAPLSDVLAFLPGDSADFERRLLDVLNGVEQPPTTSSDSPTADVDDVRRERTS
ncbi:family 78 glycoside hydrolase catalytic domain [Rhodococcus fascians]|nr:family 78 glycoside hydrolase catalytic domain [Rhodococcus fascians]